ncbi:MAG: peptidylprolyl isomerase [Acidimicrobiales bacterium]|nr:MAG: peptidylprolyl isomerase [Acidimicrobiales bacterium]
MMTRLTATLFTTSLLFSTACAQEVKTESATTQAETTAANAVAAVPAEDKASVFAGANEADWRDIDPENTLQITTDYGTFVVEMVPEFAPLHVEQIKTLARQKFYDDITFHRVIDGFMNQTGDPRGDGTGSSSLPDIKAEFTFRRAPEMAIALVGQEMSRAGEVGTGFYKSFPVATKPASQAILTKDGKVDAWGLHCSGTTSMARGGHDVNSANSQFFLMRSEYPSLNQQYTIWGMTVWGNEGLTKIKVGTKGEVEGFVPDKMNTVRVSADLPKAERIPVQVLKTDSRSFDKYLNTLKLENGTYPKVCDIKVPTRLKP